MKPVLFALLAAAALPALAQQGQLSERDRADLERRISMQQQQQREALVARARERCIEQRGVDCESPQGLTEWLNLDRSREQAVLDTLRPPQVPQSGTGSTTPPR